MSAEQEITGFGLIEPERRRRHLKDLSNGRCCLRGWTVKSFRLHDVERKKEVETVVFTVATAMAR